MRQSIVEPLAAALFGGGGGTAPAASGGSDGGGWLKKALGWGRSLFGFSEGGYTGDGGKHEPAGVVQFLNVVTLGRHYLYRAAADAAANASGQAQIQLRTMLRFPPQDNDVVKLAEPMIEGFVRDMKSWEVGVDRLVAIQFKVRETA